MKAVPLGQHSIPDSPQPRVSGTKTFQRVFWETVITKTHAHTHTGSQGCKENTGVQTNRYARAHAQQHAGRRCYLQVGGASGTHLTLSYLRRTQRFCKPSACRVDEQHDVICKRCDNQCSAEQRMNRFVALASFPALKPNSWCSERRQILGNDANVDRRS